LFDIHVESDSDGHAQLRWTKVEAWREWARLSEGCYLLRSNVSERSADDLWRAYIQLTEAEAAFRVHKSDLSIRPVWHQKQERVEAHILVCFLAYVLWKTLSAMCRQAGLGVQRDPSSPLRPEVIRLAIVLLFTTGTRRFHRNEGRSEIEHRPGI
jgi:hypothetical protein